MFFLHSLREHDYEHEHDHGHDLALELAPDAVDRRSFLKLAGFTLAGTALAGCRRPVEKAIPLLVQPEEITPGVALWYASTCGGCRAGCGVLVKNQDGRPIKLEGNPDHPLSRGGLCATGQASIVELYDSQRLKDPHEAGKPSSWPEVDRKIVERLDAIRKQGGAVRLLTGTIHSPTARALIDRFLGTFKDARHAVYEPLSCSAIADAHERTHGRRVLPRYHFEHSRVIVSLDADFLGTWISPVEFTAGYQMRRKVERSSNERSFHIQVESRFSLTGANADRRIMVGPTEYGALAAALAGALTEKAGLPAPVNVPADARVADLAGRLWEARGQSLVVCGVNDVEVQSWVNSINHLLGNYGKTIDVEQPSNQSQGDDGAVRLLLDELSAGKVAALLVADVNPVYSLPEGEKLAEYIRKVPLVVSFAERQDETGKLAHFICPQPHFLESWTDAEPVSGIVSIGQPTIQRLGHTRSLIESLSAWMGSPRTDYELVQQTWREQICNRQHKVRDVQSFWDRTVHDGCARLDPPQPSPAAFNAGAVASSAPTHLPSAAGALTLVLYPKVTLRDGRHAHNPWLQELPDPISRIAWDNYANVSPAAAATLGVVEGEVIKLSAVRSGGERTLELPVHVQPGQHDNIIAVALGYGREGTERFACIGPQWIEAKTSVGPNGRVGRNAAPLLGSSGGYLSFTQPLLRVEKTGQWQPLAAIQHYDSLDVPEKMAPAGQRHREVVREMGLREARGEGSGSKSEIQTPKSQIQNPKSEIRNPQSMWPEHRYTGHRWGMVIDLDACTGCGACVLGCQIENNIPVVGKDELARSREMHWLRIDRYYVQPDGNTSVSFQPMLCHHCENAPCETVCPVLATVHSREGLNQQVYNRCVGTRYCANNCPYKVRRFNWFAYAHGDALQNMLLNPDVTVRSRGVMEKCSFCVQRIEAARIEARRRGSPVRDGEIQPACQQSCPARAIVFGDMNDPASEVSKLMHSPRYYRALEELNVRPSVGYLAIITSQADQAEGTHHG